MYIDRTKKKKKKKLCVLHDTLSLNLFFQTIPICISNFKAIMDVCDVVQAFFHSGSLLKALNQTFIMFIPKIPNPEEVSNFRPISLCNVFYKII